MLIISGVSKKFGDTAVLDNLDLVVEPTTIVGLAGPSGSGKSTLLRIVQQLEAADCGSVQCDMRTSFMFQDFQLFPHMTVWENITYAPKINGHKAYQESAENLLAKLGIESKAQSYPSQLSGGQKQRVALARHLIMKPDILLCDEPTSGLDVATIFEVVSLLASVKAMGIAMIIASHDLDFLTKISDRIILIKSGKIVADIDPFKMSDAIGFLHNLY